MALYEWEGIYPNTMFGNITPGNVVLNSKGKIKLVCQMTFPVDHTESINRFSSTFPGNGDHQQNNITMANSLNHPSSTGGFP